MENGLTASDVALLGDRGNDFGGNSFMWIFALLILLFGGNGFGNWGGAGTNALSQADLQRAIDLSSLQTGQANLGSEIQRGIYEINGTTMDAAYNNLSEIRNVEASLSAGFAEMAKCCCETQRAIDGVNYNAAMNTASINATTTAQTQKILDAISTNRMADMQNEINSLKLQSAMCGVVRYPNAWTYNAGTSPFCGTGCGCGNV